jgi:alkylation response protein AidB-like acyl-CoA dehydrogenase
MDFALTDDQQLLARSVRAFAEAEIGPNVRAWDDAQHFPTELLPKLGALGLMGIQIPEALGGAGMSAVDYCLALEELARVDPSISLSVAAHNGLGLAHLAMFGSEAQKQRYVVPMAQGTMLAAWGLTEPGSGSDAAAMRTTARRDGDSWVLDGSKCFITHGANADALVVMAVTDKAKGAKGISAFVIERGAPGLSAGKKEDKLGMRASETSEVLMQGCRIPAENLIGELHQGFIQTLQVPAASASPLWPSAWPRAPTSRPAATPSSGSSSACTSARFPRFVRSWCVMRRRCRRHACSRCGRPGSRTRAAA